MPYSSVDEVPDNVPKAKRKQWLEVFNSAWERAKGKSKKERESFAFSEAHSVAGPNSKVVKNDVDYEPIAAGKDRCHSCEYYEDDGICSNDKVQLDETVPENDLGQKIVGLDAWCNQYEERVMDKVTEGAVTFQKFVPITKIDEAKREVGGQVTVEKKDKDGEICHYETTVPYYKSWSSELEKSSNGKNLGNLREMHGLRAAGAGKSILFNDDDKSIFMSFKVVDDDAWEKCQEGVYTGFSQGGSYIKRWQEDGQQYYTANPSEISLVDNPCLPEARFEFVRADGSTEMRKFTKVEVKPEQLVDVLQKIVDGLRGSTKKVINKALKVKTDALVKQFLEKGMYEVGRFADLLSTLAYIRMAAEYERDAERDNSKLPESLQQDLEALAETFVAMAQEETKELTTSAANAGNRGGVLAMTQTAEQIKKAEEEKVAAKAAADKVAAEKEERFKGLLKELRTAQNQQLITMLKIVGVEEAKDGFGDDEPEPTDPKKKGTKNIQTEAEVKAAKTYSQEELDAKLADVAKIAAEAATNAAILAVGKSILGDEAVDALAKKPASDDDEDDTCPDCGKPAHSGKCMKEKATKGIGDRATINRPAVRIVPVTKADDATDTDNNSHADVAKLDIGKALGGDPAEALKLMRSARPTEMPLTVASAMSSRHRS